MARPRCGLPMAQASATSGPLLTSAPVSCTLTTTNLARCREFYEKKLGLKVQRVENEGIEFACGGNTSLYIYVRSEAPRATNTVASFKVPDLKAAVAGLRANGIKFEEYDLPGLKTVNAIATTGDWSAAWFKDPDGNILAVGTQ